MAIHNPSNLYSASSAVLDTNPYTKIVLGNIAKKKAKEEALNKYFSELPAKINTAGVRQQDLEGEHGGIMNDISQWQKEWNQNKDFIKGGGMPQQKWMNKYQDIINKVSRSKQRAKEELQIGKARFEGKFNPREDDLPVIEKMGKSIYDPSGYKEDGVSEYGYGDLSGSVPAFDTGKQQQFDKLTNGLIKPVYDESKARFDNKTGEVFLPKEYDEESINTAAQNAASALTSNKSALYHYEDLMKDDLFMKSATEAFQRFYNTNELVDTPQKAAMADKIMRLASTAGEEKITDVNYRDKLKRDAEDRRNKEWREREGIRNKNIINRAAAHAKEAGTNVNNVYEKLDENQNNPASAIDITDKEGKKHKGARFNALPNDAQGILMKSLKESGNDIEAEEVYTIREPDGSIGVYRTDDNIVDPKTGKAQPIPSVKTRIFTLSKVGTNLKAQPGAPEKREVIKQGEANKKDSRTKISW